MLWKGLKKNYRLHTNVSSVLNRNLKTNTCYTKDKYNNWNYRYRKRDLGRNPIQSCERNRNKDQRDTGWRSAKRIDSSTSTNPLPTPQNYKDIAYNDQHTGKNNLSRRKANKPAKFSPMNRNNRNDVDQDSRKYMRETKYPETLNPIPQNRNVMK